jgi:AcrR family transcriptional regulator
MSVKEDGRRLRSAGSRRKIIAAMLSLIQEGAPEPPAEAVAQRAGVGLRTVFRLFNDIESVCAEMLVSQRLEFVDCFSRPFTAQEGAPRLRELFGRLAVLYEKRMPLRRAASARRYRSPSLASGMKELDRVIDHFVRTQFPGDSAADAFRIDMLNLLLGYEAWMRLRDEQGKSEAETFEVLRRGIELVLKG